MDDSAIMYLPTLGQWFWLNTPRTEGSLWKVMRGGFAKIYKRVWRYPSKSFPPGTDTKKPWGTLIKWDSTMELFVLPK